MSPGISLTNSWLGENTRRHYLFDTVKTTTLRIQRYPFNQDVAHIALISDVDLSGRTLRINSHDNQNHEYVVALIRKTPTTWWQAAGLFLARQMGIRDRIRTIER